MKNAILLHGTGGSDADYFWYADTRDYLIAKGINVWWPLLPNTQKPTKEETISFLQSNIEKFTANTVVIAHSSSCPVMLALLGSTDIHIKQAILVSGFYSPINDGDYSDLMVSETYDWSKIKSKADEIILINSDNDPWGCTAEAAMSVAKNLEAPLIVNHGQGHMGSTTMKQPYRKFELVKRLIKCD